MKSPNMFLSLVAAVAMTFGFSTSTAQGQCTADLNNDHQIDGADIGQLLGQWGTNGSADIDGSGTVDGPDLAQLLAQWGPCIVVPTWATLLEAAPNASIVTDANLRSAIVASGFAWRVRDNSSNIEMLLVPAGTFTMGCSVSDLEPCYSNESPTHQVTLTNAFYMGRYEVTQAQWLAKMGSNPSQFQGSSYPDAANRPVEKVSWDMIAGTNETPPSFMSVTELRLPTEAEWEYAYRAGTTTAFHSFPRYADGTNAETLLGNIAWFVANSGGQTHAVGGKFANASGLHDMSGNVWEWCQDLYSDSYYASSPLTNPTGPETGLQRLLRGGVWGVTPVNCRASERGHFVPNFINSGNGFRVARNP